MKLSILTLAFVILAILPQAFAMEHGTDKSVVAHEPAVTAVMFFSTSCASCKILDPRMKEALNGIEADKIDIVVFDFTNKNTIAATKALATEKGLESVLNEFGARTGFIALVDAENHITDRIGVDDNTLDIIVKLNKAIASAS